MEEELSLLDVLKLVGRYKDYLLSKKKVIIGLLIVLFGLLMFAHLRKEHSYKATLTFTTPDKKSGGKIGSALAMAKQFGIISGGGGGELSTPMIMELIVSDNIVRQALFSSFEIEGKKDLAVNHWINIKEITNKEGGVVLFDQVPTDVFKLPLEFEKLIKKISKSFRESRIEVEVSDESGIVGLKIETINQEFSVKFSNSLVDALKTNYVEKSIERQRNTFRTLDLRVDSIKTVMELREAEYARLLDSKLNVIKAEGKLREGQLLREINILNVMYAEGIKNLELARFNLLDETPVIQVIDRPTLPIRSNKKGIVSTGVLNFVLSGFLTLVLFSFLFAFGELKKKMKAA